MASSRGDRRQVASRTGTASATQEGEPTQVARKGFAPTKSGAYLPTPQPYSAKRTVVRTPAPTDEFPPFSETAQATPMCPTDRTRRPRTSPRHLESPEVIKASVDEADVENRRRSSVGSAATMAFVEATLKEDDAGAPPPPPSDTTDNSAASSRKSVTWRLPEKPKRLVRYRREEGRPGAVGAADAHRAAAVDRRGLC